MFIMGIMTSVSLSSDEQIIGLLQIYRKMMQQQMISPLVLVQVGNGTIYSDKSKAWHRVLWSLFPPNLFFGGLVILESASEENRISWNQLSACDYDSSKKTCYPLVRECPVDIMFAPCITVLRKKQENGI